MAQYSLRKITIGGGGGSGEINYPWDLTISVNSASGITEVSILPGSINNYVPSNMFETISVGTSSTLFVKLACDTDGQVLTNVILYIDANPAIGQTPTRFALPDYFEHTVGIINEGIGYNIARAFLTATGSRLFLVDRDIPAEPGQMAFDEFLVWAIT